MKSDQDVSAAAPDAGPTPRFSNSQVLLGIFIAWQIIFLLGINGLRMIRDLGQEVPREAVPREVGALLDDVAESGQSLFQLHGLFVRWGQLTAQDQNWSLFAPNVGDEVTFLEVELRWDDPQGPAGHRPAHAPELLRNPNEPDDLASYLRVGHFRLRKFESFLAMSFWRKEGETQAEAAPRWRRRLLKKVGRQWDEYLVYLNWRWQKYHREHPDRPRPTQVILQVRQYTIPPPPDNGKWPGWKEHPPVRMARWQPGRQVTRGVPPIEVYDPVTGRFESLP
jgi:hypothetical protein